MSFSYPPRALKNKIGWELPPPLPRDTTPLTRNKSYWHQQLQWVSVFRTLQANVGTRFYALVSSPSGDPGWSFKGFLHRAEFCWQHRTSMYVLQLSRPPAASFLAHESPGFAHGVEEGKAAPTPRQIPASHHTHVLNAKKTALPSPPSPFPTCAGWYKWEGCSGGRPHPATGTVSQKFRMWCLLPYFRLGPYSSFMTIWDS